MQSENVVRSITSRVVKPLASRVRFLTNDLNICGACFHRSNCLGRSLEPDDFFGYGRAISQSKCLSKGHYLFRLAQPLEALFIILSGSAKICRLDEQGNKQIPGNMEADDLLALDAIGATKYTLPWQLH